MQAGSFNLLRTDVEGWNLVVSHSYAKATPQEIEDKTGGCGPGDIGDWFVPDTMYGESIFLACQIHDWMYGEGTSIEDKQVADLVFLWNMTVLIQQDPDTDRLEGESLDSLRLRRVMTYYQAVSQGGESAFLKGKSPKLNEV